MNTYLRGSRSSRKASVQIGLLLVGGAVLLTGFGWMHMRTTSSALTLLPTPSSPQASYTGSITSVLARAQLTPAALTAAGATNRDILQMAAAVRGVMDEQQVTLDAADTAFLSAQADVERLERLAEAGQASAHDLEALGIARSARSTADASRKVVLNAIFSAATGAIGSEKSTALTQIRANAGQPVPLQYRLAARSDADWLALRNAFANARISQRRGCAADQSCQSLLATVNAEPGVVAASSRLTEAGQAVTTAWINASAAAQ